MTQRTTRKGAAEAEQRVHHRTSIGQAQRAKTRAWIIQCAIPVFAARGPDAPVIDDFAKAAGIARATFYTYFRTTRELLDATLAMLSDEFIASILPAVADEPNPVIRLATAAWLYYRRATVDPLFGAFLQSVSNVGNLATEHLRSDLTEGINAGLIKMQDVELAETIALGLMVSGLRSPKARAGGDTRALELIRATLAALGVSSSLITKSLRAIQSGIHIQG